MMPENQLNDLDDGLAGALRRSSDILARANEALQRMRAGPGSPSYLHEQVKHLLRNAETAERIVKQMIDVMERASGLKPPAKT